MCFIISNFAPVFRRMFVRISKLNLNVRQLVDENMLIRNIWSFLKSISSIRHVFQNFVSVLFKSSSNNRKGTRRVVEGGIGLSIARKHESQSPEGIPLKLVRYQAKRAKFERLLDNPVKSRESKARLWIFEVVEQATEFIRTNPQRVEDRSEVELLVYWEKVCCVPFGLRIVNSFQRIA